jgi:hypothetical protein
MQTPDFEQALWYLDVAATAGVSVALWVNGLSRVYRRLFLYLNVDLITSVLGILFQSHRNVYALIYFASQTLKFVVAVFVVLEVYRLALADHPALAAFGQRVWLGSLAVAGVISVSGIMMEYNAQPARYPILSGFRSFERTMNTWLAVFLLLIACFIAWFPVRMKRNVALYIGGFVAWFLARSSMLLILNRVPPESRHPFVIVDFLLEFACLLVWLVGLRPEGEQVTRVSGHRWDPRAVAHLSDQLGFINSSLARLGRR